MRCRLAVFHTTIVSGDVNALPVVQALMGAACFCEFMELLKAAAPLLDASETPTLAALAAFAAEFKPLPPSASAAAPGAPQPGMQTLSGVVKKAPAAGPAPAAVPPPKLGAWGRGGDVSLSFFSH